MSGGAPSATGIISHVSGQCGEYPRRVRTARHGRFLEMPLAAGGLDQVIHGLRLSRHKPPC